MKGSLKVMARVFFVVSMVVFCVLQPIDAMKGNNGARVTKKGPKGRTCSCCCDCSFVLTSARNFWDVGTVFPVCKPAAQALGLFLFAQKRNERQTVVEIGPGGGRITDELVKELGERDKLILCECVAKFCTYLDSKFQDDARVRVFEPCYFQNINDKYEQIKPSSVDTIVCSVPFRNIPMQDTQKFLATVIDILKPGGSFAYVEYTWGPWFYEKKRCLEYIGWYKKKKEHFLLQRPLLQKFRERFESCTQKTYKSCCSPEIRIYFCQGLKKAGREESKSRT